MNVTASNHEWQAMLNEEMPAVQYDIKQNRVCPPRSREAVPFLSVKCPTCKPPRDAARKKTWSGRCMQRKSHKRKWGRKTLAKKQKTRKRISKEKFIREKRVESLGAIAKIDETPSHALLRMFVVHLFVHIVSCRASRFNHCM